MGRSCVGPSHFYGVRNGCGGVDVWRRWASFLFGMANARHVLDRECRHPCRLRRATRATGGAVNAGPAASTCSTNETNALTFALIMRPAGKTVQSVITGRVHPV